MMNQTEENSPHIHDHLEMIFIYLGLIRLNDRTGVHCKVSLGVCASLVLPTTGYRIHCHLISGPEPSHSIAM